MIYRLLIPAAVAAGLLSSSPLYAKGTDFDVSAMPVSDAVSLLWNQVLHKPFMLSPELAADNRKLTFHISSENDEREFITRYLLNMNIKVTTKKGIDYISSFTSPVVKPRLIHFVYTPNYRTVSYITQSLSMFFNDGDGPSVQSSDVHNKSGSNSQEDKSGFMSRESDTLVFRGTAKQVAQLKEVLPMIDTRASEIDVIAYVYEVNTNERNGSGFSLAAKLLNGRFDFRLGTGEGYGNFIKVTTPSIDALYELFRTDSRFSVVSSPRMRVISGDMGTFSVGASVPVLGSVSYQDKNAVQSVDYHDSGVIFNVRPTITNNLITLHLDQQISNFAKTENGVNNTPTLIKREVKTAVSLKDGEIIVLSGLAENKNSDANTGFSFLPKSWSGKSKDNSKTDIVIILQAKNVTG